MYISGLNIRHVDVCVCIENMHACRCRSFSLVFFFFFRFSVRTEMPVLKTSREWKMVARKQCKKRKMRSYRCAIWSGL